MPTHGVALFSRSLDHHLFSARKTVSLSNKPSNTDFVTWKILSMEEKKQPLKGEFERFTKLNEKWEKWIRFPPAPFYFHQETWLIYTVIPLFHKKTCYHSHQIVQTKPIKYWTHNKKKSLYWWNLTSKEKNAAIFLVSEGIERIWGSWWTYWSK